MKPRRLLSILPLSVRSALVRVFRTTV